MPLTRDLCSREIGARRQPQHGQIHRVSATHWQVCVGGQPRGRHRGHRRGPVQAQRRGVVGASRPARHLQLARPKRRRPRHRAHVARSTPRAPARRGHARCGRQHTARPVIPDPASAGAGGAVYVAPERHAHHWPVPLRATKAGARTRARPRHARARHQRPGRRPGRLGQGLGALARRPQGLCRHPCCARLHGGRRPCPAAAFALQHARTAVPFASDAKRPRVALRGRATGVDRRARNHGQPCGDAA